MDHSNQQHNYRRPHHNINNPGHSYTTGDSTSIAGIMPSAAMSATLGSGAFRGTAPKRGSGNISSGGNDGKVNRREQERVRGLNLERFLDQSVRVRFNGGREITGIFKGYDQLMNLVLDQVHETLHDEQGNTIERSLGLLVARGSLLTFLAPVNGIESIANPFLDHTEPPPAEFPLTATATHSPSPSPR